jgi:hypothetical protein
MYDNNIIFVYKGVVTSDLVTHVLDMMGERLEEDKQTKKLSKKFFNVMVECLTNVYVDEQDSTRVNLDPTAVLMVKREEGAYCVTTGHFIYNERVSELKKLLDKVNKMEHTELKAYYQELLRSQENNTNANTLLAMVDLTRKSRHKLVYQFKYVTSEYTFFSLEARISNNSI